MAEEPSQRSGWLLEPPGAGEMVVQIAAGEGAEFDESQQAALDALLAALHEADEVSGFAGCSVEGCAPKMITIPNCRVFEFECKTYAECRIGSFY